MLRKYGFEPPKCETTLKKYTADEADNVRCRIIEKLRILKVQGKKFTTSIDEQTTSSNFRILNVHLYSELESFNLGMVRINVSCTAETMVNLTNERLKMFNIEPTDIIATITDGAAVCKSYGNKLKVFHQLCYDHGIHLAVVKVIYKLMQDVKTHKQIVFEDEEMSEEANEAIEVDEDAGEAFELRNEIGIGINRVREIVKIFKKSPKLNDILQAQIFKDIGKKLQLKLDVRTRWNSLLTMLKTFIRVSNAVERTLTNINRDDLWSEDLVPSIENVLKVLNVTKLAMDAISKDEANLLTSEGAFEFLFDELIRMDSSLSLDLVDQLKIELSKRRQTSLVSLLKFLQNPDTLSEDKDSYFAMTSKISIFALASQIWKKYFVTHGEHSVNTASVPLHRSHSFSRSSPRECYWETYKSGDK